MPSPKVPAKKKITKQSTVRPGSTKATSKQYKNETIASPSIKDIGPRRLPAPPKIWYKPLSWRRSLPAPKHKPLSKARSIVAKATVQLASHAKLFIGLSAIYAILNVLLVRGLTDTTDLGTFKSLFENAFTGAGGAIKTVFGSFVYIVTTSGGGGTATSGTYQSLLLIICSLAFIWALRQTSANNKPRIRDGFYKGMYPFVPFLLVLCVIGLQLLPAVAGSYLYSAVVKGGIAIDFGEKLAFGIAAAIPFIWSLRMVTSSIFALYIVTLPDMDPLEAVRSANKLVFKRRMLIWRKVLLLPFVLLAAAAIVEVPFILFLTAAASWAFFVFSMAAVAFVHAYMYTLYRELL